MTQDSDFSPRVTSPYLMGVYLALNAIPDAYLFLDGPSCFPLKTPSVQGNHDWLSSLSNVSGYQKCVTSKTGPSTVVFPREQLYMDALSEMLAHDETGGVFVSARPMAAITGVDYDRICALARESLPDKYILPLQPKSLQSDWLGGYEQAQLSFARAVDLAGAEPKAGTIAIVGYLFDRNEGDHEGNLRELRRLLAAIGLDLEVVWLSGGRFDELAAIGKADAIISLPYGRKAASVLAGRLDRPVIETVLPFGFGATERFLRDVGTALDREEQAEELIDAELTYAVPRLEWVIPFVFQTAKLGFIGDPHHLSGFADMVDMLGAELTFACTTAQRRHLDGLPDTLPEERLIAEPTQRFLVDFVPRQLREVGLDLLVSSNVGTRLGDLPIMEFGFPSYYTHALAPQPFLGFVGALAFIERMANTIRHREL